MGSPIARESSAFLFMAEPFTGEQRRDIVSVFEAVGGHAAGTVSDIELQEVEATAIPGPGSCGGMYTANTMASSMKPWACLYPIALHKTRLAKPNY